MAAPAVVTFDAGQTLVALDVGFLAQRASERGVAVEATRLAAALPEAWLRHDALIAHGVAHPWRGLMAALLEGAGVDAEPCAELVDWLWHEQPRRNLWREPIAGMIALARELRSGGARVGVLSNSEGGLAALLEELGVADAFDVIVDSGRLGFHKPDPRIFTHTLSALGVDPRDVVPIHIGDSWQADIAGARAMGWNAIWYGREARPVSDQAVASARDVHEVRAALMRWGVLT